MTPKSISSDEKQATEFMLAEYATLRELRQGLSNTGESRVNFFVAVITGAVVGLGLINQLSGNQEILYFINGAMLVGLLLFGLITFARTVERTLTMNSYSRGMSRIRRYFVDKNPEIGNYIWLPTNDDNPSLDPAIFKLKAGRIGTTGLPPLVAILNSLIATVGIVILVRMLLFADIVWCFVIGAGVFMIVGSLQYVYYANRVRVQKREVKVHFPTTNKKE